VTAVRITHLGTATTILEIGGVRLLTDPAFDPPGTKWHFGFGMRSTKTDATAMKVEDVGKIDALLVTHDQHGDNLDTVGRELLATAPRILTTRAAERRLVKQGIKNVEALAPFTTTEIGKLRITATPCRHGPPLSEPFVGEVIGFMFESSDFEGSVYVSGDTVWFGGVEEVSKRFTDVRVALPHLGCASYGPLRFTMNAKEGVTFARAFPKATIIPVHYDGWTHFKETRPDFERAFEEAKLSDRVTWLERGVARDFSMRG
jgi:L-ascorbate metabolism protein UlaG (beta-lactamase superfamily)